jgi:glucose dehydrogenase
MRRNGAFFLIMCGGALLAASSASLAINWSMLGGDPQHTGYRADPLKLPISLLWKYRAAEEKAVVTVWSSPASSDDAVFFCYDTRVYCVDRMTGQMRWQYEAQTQLRSSPAIDDRGIYVGGRNGMLYAVARDTGQLMWRYPLPGKKAIDSSPTIFNGAL